MKKESDRSSSNGLGLGDCSEDLGLYSDCDGKQLEVISKGMIFSKCFSKDHPDWGNEGEKKNKTKHKKAMREDSDYNQWDQILG